MHGPNDQHDTEHCHIVKQALLAYKESIKEEKSSKFTYYKSTEGH